MFYYKKCISVLILCMICFVFSGCNQQYNVEQSKATFKLKPLKEVSMISYLTSKMTLEEKIAQHFILGFHGTNYNDTLVEYNRLKIGGVILFSRNIHNASQTQMLNEAIMQDQQGIPMFIAVDQEGGRVNRFPKEVANIEPAYQIRSSGDPMLAYDKGEYIGRQLKQLSFNVDFAPSLDIWSNPSNKVIGDRSFGTNYHDVIKYGLPFNRGINDQNIITSAKHFPGHGDTIVDSHESLPVSTLNKERLWSNELQPFKAAIKDEIDMIMVSHILFPEIDGVYPSSMSKKMINDILVHQLGYDGVIVTDDLAMGAIVNSYTREQALINAINAGETMLLIGSDIGDIRYQIQFLKSQVESGKLNRKIIDKNVQKILKLKQKYGIV
ncbi:glycoside hydrolase family 3 N-terminal domain-containing protein [Macrococcus animalis]|uniref:glycoside hydrolase family 3 N-terminal domain-containing protein n=1 Tax=Macrococcus animalis TaxID=3395467 RepID=UPI0039BE4CE6